MNFEKIRKEIADLQLLQVKTAMNVTLVIKDKEVSLEERWGLFSSSWGFLPELSYGNGNVQILGANICLYDDFGIHRHEEVTYTQMYETIQEWIAGGDKGITQEMADEWREAVLEEAYYSFTFDW